jgi:predicted RNase H-like HicB family nuclease
MKPTYSAVIQRNGKWWIGWIEELSGVNAQSETREELLGDLKIALNEALEMNRVEAISATSGDYEEVSIEL